MIRLLHQPLRKFVRKRQWLLSITAIFCIGLAPVQGWSQNSEQQLPIAIEADSAEQDEQLGLTIYRGNVTMIQGELRIEAHKVEIHSSQDQQQNRRRVSRISASGDPAVFSHHGAESSEQVVAQAQEINYQPDTGIVVMQGNASLVQQGSSVKGNKIEYFVEDKKVKAAANPQDKKTRVKTVIMPGQDIAFDTPDNSAAE